MTADENRYRQIIETTAEGYCLLEAVSWRVIEVNEALCRLLGTTPSRLVGSNFLDLACAETRVELQRALESESAEEAQHRFGMDGHCRAVAISAAPGALQSERRTIDTSGNPPIYFHRRKN